ncbi:PIN-like domain-containing protein [Nocardia sp. NPDC003963]
MKSKFPDWYGPTPAEMKRLLGEATVALDANVLLTLYRVNNSQRDQVFKSLSKVSDQLWLPYTAAHEYQKNRFAALTGQQGAYEELVSRTRSLLHELRSNLRTELQDLNRDTRRMGFDREMLAVIESELNEVNKKVDSAILGSSRRIISKFETIRRNNVRVVDHLQDDPIREALDAIFTESKVGDQPDSATLASRVEQAKERARLKIPPGYLDDKSTSPYGDTLIWFELLEHAKASSKPLIYITNDTKEDMYMRVQGRIVGPRVELISEMRQFSGQQYFQTTLDRFIRLINIHLSSDVTAESIENLYTDRNDQNSIQEPAPDQITPADTSLDSQLVSKVAAVRASAVEQVSNGNRLDPLIDLALLTIELQNKIGKEHELTRTVQKELDEMAKANEKDNNSQHD